MKTLRSSFVTTGAAKLSLAAAGLLWTSTAIAQPWNVTIDPRSHCSSDANGPGTILSMAPGKYDLIPIGGAVNVWSAVSDCNPDGSHCDAGWLFLFYVRINTQQPVGLPEACCPREERWATESLAFAHARRSVLRVPGPNVANVKFFFMDQPCSDNLGTMFLQVVPACIADFNSDQVVDFFDYLDFVDAFSAFSSIADVNSDGVIDFFDYLDFVDAFSVGC